jgi:hypothetical protein
MLSGNKDVFILLIIARERERDEKKNEKKLCNPIYYAEIVSHILFPLINKQWKYTVQKIIKPSFSSSL